MNRSTITYLRVENTDFRTVKTVSGDHENIPYQSKRLEESLHNVIFSRIGSTETFVIVDNIVDEREGDLTKRIYASEKKGLVAGMISPWTEILLFYSDGPYLIEQNFFPKIFYKKDYPARWDMAAVSNSPILMGQDGLNNHSQQHPIFIEEISSNNPDIVDELSNIRHSRIEACDCCIPVDLAARKGYLTPDQFCYAKHLDWVIKKAS